jgi:hypothetical protein
MALQQYITSADITSTVLKDFNVASYIVRTNDHLESLAISLDCYPEEISIPINSLVKEYLVNYCNMIISQDKIGTNNIELSQDKYIVIHSIFNKEVERLRGYISYETLTNDLDEAADTSRTNTIYRS